MKQIRNTAAKAIRALVVILSLDLDLGDA